MFNLFGVSSKKKFSKNVIDSIYWYIQNNYLLNDRNCKIQYLCEVFPTDNDCGIKD